ncbi:quinolinate synthase NadA [Alicyclobacillus acidocaldarius]|uniref:Quinolinate synthase n=1 Tax=Alicyclobacillus acidocaldarius subsp. acidocaldarius (strain ATCC 27009 / DSM 446 / BCRC 14685 / JCM 5260 / KCTC 1825 / NBRC 15652 / NCIMB 11725 / NRRL B-14509 / 104-IA) TaxID=521098 RepID=C8WSJ7_ALIAD|nr:quinolinate synthase NadA [Alicyclobacillus acidocaldarius]ACV59482.1 quinolinate synthetase complex, A subunit [Alicyclobacillus acidocaldarius subsp. acidocaldarius DSM 446]
MLETKAERQALVDEILEWKKKRNALILAHNYELPEIQDIADVLGDSLALARAAMRADADVIVLCGVHFMAETAAILNPDKTVLLPDPNAGCSLADSITADALRAWKAEHPGAVVVSYVNTSAEVKAESDYCCTSSNAVQVVRSIPEDREILFLPDMFLGSYVKRVTGRENLHIWMGECHVHAGIRPHDIEETLSAHPDAELLIHPECGCSTSNMYLLAEGQLPADRTHVLSTSGMLQRARESDKRAFIVATEVGILYQMERQNPDKTFIPANRAAVCPFMKMITLEKVRDALARLETVISVPADVAARARVAIERMVAIG